MIKKYASYLGVLVLISFSFFYTDKAVDIVKRNDPIMKSIMSNKDNYEINAVSAIINSDEIIPGVNGLIVDINKSYSNMKKYNKYDDSMYVFEEIEPSVSLVKKYDKYIVGGNKEKKEVALIFKIDDISYLNKINAILIDKNEVATFFIDGSLIDEGNEEILELANNKYEIENLGYDGIYSIEKFNYTNNLIAAITKMDPKYCYVDYKNNDVLELCSKYNMYTIKPSISINVYPFLQVKQNLNNGLIIGFDVNSDTIKELPSIISYIKQKGYELVTVNDLINEKRIEE